MPSVILEGLQIASFRGVQFLFRENTITAGRKTVTHEFIEQDTREVEDLGKYPRSFEITGFIASPTFDYFTQRLALITALNTKGSGKLVHPYDGSVNVSLSQPYTLKEGLSSLGVAEFGMVFEETGLVQLPNKSSSFASNVEGQLDNYLLTLREDFEKYWSVRSGFLNNFQFSLNLLNDVGSEFSDFPSLVNALNSEGYGLFTEALGDFNNNVSNFVVNSSDLTNSITNLFDTGGNITTDSSERSTLMETFFNYSSSDPIVQTTVGLAQRELNRVSLNQLINSHALAFDYVFTTQTQFTTQETIQAQSDLLNDQFTRIIENNIYQDILGNTIQILSNETISQLSDMRAQTHEYLRDQDATTQSILDVHVPRNSLLSLTYGYYGNVDLKQALYDLNRLGSPINISGNFKIISDVSNETI